MNQPTNQDEQEYRRAYRDGWIQAVEAMGELMSQYHLSRRDAYYVAYDHWAGMLDDWEERAKQGQNASELPPAITAEQRKISPLLKRSIRG